MQLLSLICALIEKQSTRETMRSGWKSSFTWGEGQGDISEGVGFTLGSDRWVESRLEMSEEKHV